MRDRIINIVLFSILVILGFIAGIVLMMMFENAAHASRPAPHYSCKAYMEPRIMCEAQYVEPLTPEWSVYLDDVLVEYDDGVTVYLTIPQKWVRVQICAGKKSDRTANCVGFRAKWFNHKVYFDKEEP